MALLTCSREILEDAVKTFDYLSTNWNGSHINGFTVSKGIAIGAEHEASSLEELIELADKLMYGDKDVYYQKTGKVRRKVGPTCF